MEQFHEYFENPAFRSDGLKIYPTLVIRGTGLYELWRTGRYKNYTPNALVDIVARILSLIPPWTRIYRVQRSVVCLFLHLRRHLRFSIAEISPCPSFLPVSRTATFASSLFSGCAISASPAATFEIVKSGCTRSTTKFEYVLSLSPSSLVLSFSRSQPDELELIRRDYTANGGWETFLSYEDPERDILVGLLRLRKCSKEGTFREELLKDGQCSMVRELHGACHSAPPFLPAEHWSQCTERRYRCILGTRRCSSIRESERC